MHLLAATPGTIEDGTDPVDPGQTPADVVVISAADTELAALSEARAEMPDPPGLRLLNLAYLRTRCRLTCISTSARHARGS